VSGSVDRAARRLLHLRVLSAALLCALTYWFADMAATYRPANPYLALSVLVAIILVVATCVLLVRRVADATPSEVAAHVLETIERLAPLIVINLIVASILAPFLRLLATFVLDISALKISLTLLGLLSSRVLFWVFCLGIAGLLAITILRGVDVLVLRWRPMQRAARVADRAVIIATTLYCAWAMALTFNGCFDAAPATEHRSQILAVWGIPRTALWWADVRSWEPAGGIKRVFIAPGRDHVMPTLLSDGQPVRIWVRPGLFGLRWVERLQVDFEHEIAPLVAAAPSAAAPRRWLIETLLRDAQWTEAARQAQIYARYHPQDREFVSRVTAALRAARQTRPAAELDRLGVPTARTRSSG
jgi:hypothetical protein